MFTGRDYYLDCLNALWRKTTASLAVISGRRRIGKSTLVEHFAAQSKCRFIEIEGLAPDKSMTNAKQIENFCERLAKATGLPEAKADGWPKAFDALESAIRAQNVKTIVFLDEISWMGGYDSSFAAYLKNAWDTQFSRCGKLIMVLAGSVSSWIQANILNSKAFVGRISMDITLPELPLANCLDFWGTKKQRTSLREIIDVLSVTGGIPKYLQEIDPVLSASENIRRLCFVPEGYLFRDFDSIFSDIFGSATTKKQILLALADGQATLSQLADIIGVSANGHLAEDLRDLCMASFISQAVGNNPETGAALRETPYRLKDNYTRFYLKFILPKATAIKAGLFRFTELDNLPGWNAIMGLQFENLIINNLKSLSSLIGLNGKLVTSAAPFLRRGKSTVPGVQIDLLVQTPKSVYVIEIKRKNSITESVEQEVQAKVAKLRLRKNISVRTVLVYDGHLAPSIEEDGYFDYLIPIEQLFTQRPQSLLIPS